MHICRVKVPALLEGLRLGFANIQIEGTPRRVAVMVSQLAKQQKGAQDKLRGPPAKVLPPCLDPRASLLGPPCLTTWTPLPGDVLPHAAWPGPHLPPNSFCLIGCLSPPIACCGVFHFALALLIKYRRITGIEPIFPESLSRVFLTSPLLVHISATSLLPSLHERVLKQKPVEAVSASLHD